MNRLNTLTPAETVVYAGLVAGESAKVAAHKIGIAMRTVEHHRQVIYRKLGVDTHIALLAKLLREKGEAA